MEKDFFKLTSRYMVSETNFNISRVNSALELAKNFATDPDLKIRKSKNKFLCKVCYYGKRIAGAAMTTSFCGWCGKELLSGSTDTHKLCLECSREHSLCRHCGGDIDLRNKRRIWPEKGIPPEESPGF